MTMPRIIITLAILAVSHIAMAGKPLKIYILAGQSNMQGQASPRTFPHMMMDPKSKTLHDKMVDQDGKPRIFKNVYIAAFSASGGWGVPFTPKSKHGPLTIGFGGTTQGDTIGPELGFGVTMYDLVKEPILIIKTSWGGRSLHHHFRPPSAGVEYPPFTEEEIEAMKNTKSKKKVDVAAEQEKREEKNKEAGEYYRLMMKHVKAVLADPAKFHPAYDPKQGVELAGFVWFQGFNDMVSGYYPSAGRREPRDYSKYSELLAHFIRDVRKELKAPKMPFVIGVIGVGGKPESKNPFRDAMAAPAAMPEFKGNVVAVHTAKYWDHELEEAVIKAGALAKVKRTPYRLNKYGAIEVKSITVPGWVQIGLPLFEQRKWRYVSYQKDPKDFYRKLKKGEPGDERFFKQDVPAKYAGWQKPGFDVSKWQAGLAPVGKGTFYQKGKAKVEAPTVHSKWGKGNMLLMRTSFEVNSLDYEGYRLCIMASKSFNVYLNGHKIHTYVWWKGQDYRTFELSKELASYLKKGTNVLAVQSNIWGYRGKEGSNWVNATIEGLTKEGKANLTRIYDGICSPREREIARGRSNQGFHYMGSSKIYSQIGEAFANALGEMKQ